MPIETAQQFYLGLTHLDNAHHENRSQTHAQMQVFINLVEAARRQRKAIEAKDWAQVDIENSYIASLSEQGERKEREEMTRHEADRQIWWECRPNIAFKGDA